MGGSMSRFRSLVRPLFGLCLLFVFVGVMTFETPEEAQAQFGIKLPKIPKILKGDDKEDKKSDAKSQPAADKAKKPKGPVPEITSVEPDSVPPGWEGDVVFTGTNLAKGMTFMMECGSGVNYKPRDFRVESATRATLAIEVSEDAEEKKCKISVAAAADTMPSDEGSPEVTLMTAGFGVSEDSKLPRAYKACLLGEGEMEMADLMTKFSETMTKAGQDPCKLMVSSTSVKYSVQDKTLVDQSASSIKSIEPLMMMGQAMMFRIVADGKIYNFMPSGQEAERLVKELKRKLGK